MKMSVKPSFFPSNDSDLPDLLLEFFKESTALGRSLQKETRRRISDIIQRVSCYHAHLIAGHHIKPMDIEMAARKEFSDNPSNRSLQEWSYSYIHIQKQIDIRLLTESSLNISSIKYLEWIHKVFYSLIPDEFLRIKNRNNHQLTRIIPGKLPEYDDEDKNSRNYLLKEEFSDLYNPENVSGDQRLHAAVASHSRLHFLFPIQEVTDIISQFYTVSFFKLAGLDALGLFSLTRMIARNQDEYRGTLNLAAKSASAKNKYKDFGLREFCRFFVSSCINEIRFMKELTDPERLQKRIIGYVHLRSRGMLTDGDPLREEAKYILTGAMLRGSLPRGEAKRITGLGERTARSLLSRLLEEKLLVSENHKAPVKFNIPPKAIGYYLPDLYPESMV